MYINRVPEMTGRPICVACVGVFEVVGAPGFNTQLLDAANVKSYKFSSFSLSVTTSVQVLIRRHLLW